MMFDKNLMRKPRSSLVIFIIAKAILETLFVIFLVVSFHYRTFYSRFDGRIDEANGRRVAGWMIAEAEPSKPVEMQLYINDEFAASSIADRPRRSAANVELAQEGAHKFAFDVPPLAAGNYEARVYVVHESGGDDRRTLQALPQPARFRVDAERSEASELNGGFVIKATE